MERSLENFKARANRILTWDPYFFQKHFDMSLEELVAIIDAKAEIPTPLPVEKTRFETYGSWSLQEPAFGTIGRFNPDMTVQTGPNAFDLKYRFDRAMYTHLQSLGLDDEKAFHASASCPAWSGVYNTQNYGTWRFRLTIDSPDIEIVAMLWPQDNDVWPDSEVNIVEGRVSDKNPLTNVHWKNEYGEHRQVPMHREFDMLGSHEYTITVAKDKIVFWYDQELIRTIPLTPQNHPLRNPVHFVVQGGWAKSVREVWNPSLPGFETTVKLELLEMP